MDPSPNIRGKPPRLLAVQIVSGQTYMARALHLRAADVKEQAKTIQRATTEVLDADKMDKMIRLAAARDGED